MLTQKSFDRNADFPTLCFEVVNALENKTHTELQIRTMCRHEQLNSVNGDYPHTTKAIMAEMGYDAKMLSIQQLVGYYNRYETALIEDKEAAPFWKGRVFGSNAYRIAVLEYKRRAEGEPKLFP